MHTSRTMRRQLERDNAKQPVALAQVPKDQWPSVPKRLIEVWRSRDFLVQVFNEHSDIVRLSICRTSVDAKVKRWDDGISWDELQQIKRECGYGRMDAVEVYPADADIVNVANMRHLWVLPDHLGFAWRRNPTKTEGE